MATFSHFQVYLNVTQAKRTTSLLLFNSFYPAASYRTSSKEKECDELSCIRFGRSLWSAQPTFENFSNIVVPTRARAILVCDLCLNFWMIGWNQRTLTENCGTRHTIGEMVQIRRQRRLERKKTSVEARDAGGTFVCHDVERRFHPLYECFTDRCSRTIHSAKLQRNARRIICVT